ncbi:class I SAM-dependent methyltransferase [Niabella drilacis]|uniref:Methyltransferase domain-containing protein n=1 Tax=Niabella drilacis (strain DSM 25811 / CCM 8410 / CCUG 62505 / LMG 26954 / E90) TaxID=1285928 RepID=A0A1G6MY63_NIADE|nr:class I SAM-dependent methyltransferase [Niabella drilacis]SDC60184.1 Methyltransferase domain-containing protein [Niabella drilacis]
MQLSPRLAAIVNALPLWPGIRVLEIGCGPGVAAREIAKRIGNGYILGIDRSAKAIQQARKSALAGIAPGILEFQQIAVEDFKLPAGDPPFDLAFAVRVGALDGRHPQLEQQALANIAKALTKTGRLFIDGSNPLKELSLLPYR